MLTFLLAFLFQFILAKENVLLEETDASTGLIVIDSCTNFDLTPFEGEFRYTFCIEPANINNKLKEINADSDSVVILSDLASISIDFQNLDHKVSVNIAKLNADSQLKLLNGDSKKVTLIKNAIDHYKRNPQSRIKEETTNLIVEISGGNIKEKVSSLNLILCTLLVRDSELTTNDIQLSSCSISQDTNTNINAQLIIIDSISFENIIQNSYLKGQFVLSLIDKNLETIKISFTNEMWKVQATETDAIDTSIQIGYNYFSPNKLFLWCSAKSFDFHVEDSTVTNANPVNITIFDSSQTDISIIASGTWDLITQVSVYITANHDIININTDNSNEKINIIKENLSTDDNNNGSDDDSTINSESSSDESEPGPIPDDSVPIKPPTDDGEIPGEVVSQPEFINQPYTYILITKSEQDYSLCLSSKEDYDYCKEYPNATDRSCHLYKGFIDYICLNKTADFNSKLESINSGKLLEINTDTDISGINLALIKEKTNISISRNRDSKEEIYIEIDGGNFQTKVSNIMLKDLNIRVTKSPLIIDGLILRNSKISSDSQNIELTNFILDKESYANINLEKVQCKYMVFRIENLIQRHYIVSFENDKWKVFMRYHNKYDFELFFSVPYSATEKLNLIARSHSFEFYAANNQITKVKDVNITLLDPNYKAIDMSLDRPKWKYLVKFSNYGDWSGISEKLQVYFSYYENFVEFENNCDSKVNLIKAPLYDPIPIPTPEPTTREPYPDDHPHQPNYEDNSDPYIDMYVSKNPAGCNYFKELIQKCKDNPESEECLEIDYSYEIVCVSNVNNINNDLAAITSNANLNIVTEMNIPSIDFNKLASKRSVIIKSEEEFESKLLSKKSKFNERSKRKEKVSNLKKNKENEIVITVGIQGNIKEKVSKLVLSADQYSPKMSLKVLSSPLNVDSLDLNNCIIDESSETIEANRMMVTRETFYMIENLEKIHVKQFSLYIPQSGALMYRISFDGVKWEVRCKFYFSDDDYDLTAMIPYTICTRFNLIAVAHFFDLNLAKSNINSVKPINITILTIHDYDEYTGKLLEESNDKFLVKLTSSGEWSKLQKSPSVYFTSFQDYVILEEKCDSKITVSQFGFNKDGSITPPAPDEDDDFPIVDVKIGPYQPPFNKFMYSSQLIISNDKEICDGVKQGFEYCKANPNEEGCYLFEDLKYYGCSSPQNINNELPNIPDDCYSLSILTFTNIDNVDFNKLKHKMTVYVTYENDDESLRLLSNSKRRINKKSKINAKDSSVSIGMIGNAKDKVTFLTLHKLSLNVLESPLNIESLYLRVSTIQSTSQKIQVDNLIVDGISHGNILDNSAEKINVKQYALKNFEQYNSEYKYRIVFENDKWVVQKSNILFDLYIPFFPTMDFDENPDMNPSDFDDYPFNIPSYVPYNLCERFAFIIPSSIYELHAKGNVAKAVNITVMDLDSLLLDTVKFPVSIYTTGNWDSITEPVSLYVTTFKNLIELNTAECSPKVVISRYDAFNPVIITDSTSKDDTSKGEIDTSQVDQDKVKDEIKNKFDQNDDGDQFVTITNDETSFADLDLKPNEFIKLKDNAQVTLSGGNLNLFLNDSSSVKIKVENNDDIKLSIKNKADCTVNIETTKTEVSINSNSEVYNTLTLTVPDKVENIKISSINLHDSGSIVATKSSNPNIAVPVTVDNLQAQAQTSGKLTKVTVENELTISETASLELDEVTLKNSKLNLNLHSYTHANYIFPMLHGKIGEPPSEIKISAPTNGKTAPSSQDKDKEFLIFEGTFTSSCEEWSRALDLTEVYFNKGVCKPLSGTLEERSSLVMKFTTDKDDDGNGDGDGNGNGNGNGSKEDGGKKLTSAQIAGIVVGVVAVVAIIVIIVVVVVIKKKKKQQNSSAESEKEQSEL